MTSAKKSDRSGAPIPPNQVAHVFTIRGGKIVAFNEFTDTAAVRLAYRKAMTA
ncbi:MAG TPA: hypothetical protein VJ124_17065 [Pyrinomonadaceae bacterium]|nr:hypothetical protein [Pyrinomonadaceae bacterium]